MRILASHASSIAEVKLIKEFSMMFIIRVSFFPCDFWLGGCWILSCQEHKRNEIQCFKMFQRRRYCLNGTALLTFISSQYVGFSPPKVCDLFLGPQTGHSEPTATSAPSECEAYYDSAVDES
jgi:hypothetical protein